MTTGGFPNNAMSQVSTAGEADARNAVAVSLDATGKLVSFVIGSGKDGSRLEPERPPLNVPTTRRKIYWNTKSDG